MALRRFLYLNDATVDDFLGQLEFGVADDEVHTETKERSGDAGLKMPAVNFGGSRSSAVGVERNVRQNSASRFARLYRLLQDTEPSELWVLSDIDTDTWKCLDRGSLLELELNLTVPQFARFMSAANAFVPLMEAVGSVDPSMVDPETRSQVLAFSQFATGGSGTEITLTGEMESSPSYSFGCRLNRSGLLGPLDNLEGTYTVLGQVVRIVEEGDSEILFDIPAMAAMNRRDRRKAGKDISEEFVVKVNGPGAILDVVAIYR
jgi:hypothetical protein